MRVVARTCVYLCAVVLALIVAGAQERPAAPSNDPRVGLKAGFRDAGVAARNMELVATLPKPQGFFDPKEPAGPPTAPEAAGRGGSSNQSPEATPPAVAGTPATPAPPAEAGAAPAVAPPAGGGGSSLNFANSDIAFSGTHMFLGSYH